MNREDVPHEPTYYFSKAISEQQYEIQHQTVPCEACGSSPDVTMSVDGKFILKCHRNVKAESIFNAIQLWNHQESKAWWEYRQMTSKELIEIDKLIHDAIS